MAKSGFVPLLIMLLGLRLGGETPRPVKLQVDLSTKSVSVGERANMNVHLVDGDNRPVPAPKDFKVEIVVRLPSNATETLASAVLKAGQSSMRVELPPAKTEGWLYIWAKQPELRLGGTFMRVKPPTRSQPGGARPPRRRRRLWPNLRGPSGHRGLTPRLGGNLKEGAHPRNTHSEARADEG